MTKPKRTSRPTKRLTPDELGRATKRQYRTAHASGHPITWKAARERAFAWERGRAGERMYETASAPTKAPAEVVAS